MAMTRQATRIYLRSRHDRDNCALRSAGLGAAYGVSLYAYNQTFSWQTFSIAVGLGAILAPMAVFCPPFGILLGTLGTLTGAVATYNVFTDPNATWGQVAASLVLTVAAGWGTYKGWQWWGLVKTFTQGNGLWVNPFQIAIRVRRISGSIS